MSVLAADVAKLAEFLADGARIPYVYGHETITKADCQGFIEAVIRKLGGVISYKGSNDWYRNGVDFITPIDQAKSGGIMRPGGLLFLHKFDGGEKERGYHDGLGNAKHIGIYTGGKYFSVHSSSIENDVVGTNENYPWSYYAESKDLIYPFGDNTNCYDKADERQGYINQIKLLLDKLK